MTLALERLDVVVGVHLAVLARGHRSSIVSRSPQRRSAQSLFANP
jgi:hypothetical protein